MKTLCLQNISKSFGPTKILSGVTAEFRAGEITALLGGNGAGKSTLMNILSGSLPQDSGDIRLDGTPVRFANTREAMRAGIGIVHQHSSLIDSWSVWEHFEQRFAALSTTGRAAAQQRAVRFVDEISPGLDLNKPVLDLTSHERQVIEIAKTLSANPQVLLFDEPTAGLDERARSWILTALERLASAGKIVILVSHDIPTVLNISHKIFLLHGGRIELKNDISSLRNEPDIEELQKLEEEAPPSSIAADSVSSGKISVVTSGQNLTQITMRSGDILGVAGEAGSNAEEFLRSIVGLATAPNFKAGIDGMAQPTDLEGVSSAGVAYVSREREAEWIFGEHSVVRNLLAGRWTRESWTKFISSEQELNEARELIHKYKIQTISPHSAAKYLSGGNQQKVVIARASATRPKFLLLDEPFSGVDAKTRATVIREMRSLASVGVLVIAFSRETREMAVLANKWIFLRRSDDRPTLFDKPLSCAEIALAQSNARLQYQRGSM